MNPTDFGKQCIDWFIVNVNDTFYYGNYASPRYQQWIHQLQEGVINQLLAIQQQTDETAHQNQIKALNQWWQEQIQQHDAELKAASVDSVQNIFPTQNSPVQNQG